MDFVEIKQTKNRGKGVFALKDFEKDELILRISGDVIETEKPETLPKDFQDHCFPFDERISFSRLFAPAAPWKFLNHSCDPNAGIKNNLDIVAMRHIKKGEEIVFDYAMNNIDGWAMKCDCGSRNCRKLVSTFGALDKKTKKKYSGYVLDCILRE